MKIDEFQRHLKVDKNELDLAAEIQAQLYFDAAEEQVHANQERDRLKWELQRIEARLYEEIASGPDKLSDSRIRSQLALRPERDAAELAYMSAKGLADRWSAMLSALSERGSVIRKLSDLYTASYFAVAQPASKQEPQPVIRRGVLRR